MSKFTAIFSSVQGNRPNDTTSYSAGDVFGDPSLYLGTQLKFSNFGISNSSIFVKSGALSLNTTIRPTENPFFGFRLHLYNEARPTGIPDNSPWTLVDNPEAKYRGYIDFIPYVQNGNYLYFQNNNIDKQIKIDSAAAVYGHLVTLGTYANPPASMSFMIELNGIQL